MAEGRELNDIGVPGGRARRNAGVPGVGVHYVQGIFEHPNLAGSQTNAALGQPPQLAGVAEQPDLKGRQLARFPDLHDLDSGVVFEAEEVSELFFEVHDRLVCDRRERPSSAVQ